jgi:hypothetical protein
MLFNILNFFSESIFFFLNGFCSAVVSFPYYISLVFNAISINETFINVLICFIFLSCIFVFLTGRGIGKIVKEASLVVGGLATGYIAFNSGSNSGDDDRKRAEDEARKAEAEARKAEAEARTAEAEARRAEAEARIAAATKK